MPFQTCEPCDAVFLVGAGDPPHCPYCLGALGASDLTAASARVQRPAGMSLAVYPEGHRTRHLHEAARAAVEQSRTLREELRAMRAENARLRGAVRARLAERREAVGGEDALPGL